MRALIAEDLAEQILALAAADGTTGDDMVNRLLRQSIGARPVYAVEAELPYSDYDAGDQDTPVHHWSVVCEDRPTAESVRTAAGAELDRAKVFSGESVWVYQPVDRHRDDAIVGGVREAIADLRSTLVCHRTGSVTRDRGYWKSVGLTDEEVSCLMEDFDLGLWNYYSYGEDLGRDLEEYVAAKLDGTETHIPKLRQWVEGRSS